MKNISIATRAAIALAVAAAIVAFPLVSRANVAVQQGQITVADSVLAYRTLGAGPPIILLPGGFGVGSAYVELTPIESFDTARDTAGGIDHRRTSRTLECEPQRIDKMQWRERVDFEIATRCRVVKEIIDARIRRDDRRRRATDIGRSLRSIATESTNDAGYASGLQQRGLATVVRYGRRARA